MPRGVPACFLIVNIHASYKSMPQSLLTVLGFSRIWMASLTLRVGQCTSWSIYLTSFQLTLCPVLWSWMRTIRKHAGNSVAWVAQQWGRSSLWSRVRAPAWTGSYVVWVCFMCCSLPCHELFSGFSGFPPSVKINKRVESCMYGIYHVVVVCVSEGWPNWKPVWTSICIPL